MSLPIISVIIPARMQNIRSLDGILRSLSLQTCQQFEVIIVCDREFTGVAWDYLHYIIPKKYFIADRIRFFSHLNSDFEPQSAGGASYVRNFGIKQARGEFVLLLDDDNAFEADYLSLCLEYYRFYQDVFNAELILTPTLMWRDSGRVQNNGFSCYNYFLSRPQIFFLAKDQEYAEVQMYSGNGVFGRTSFLQEVFYDEEIARIAEDLDFTYRLHKKGGKILTLAKLVIYHRERDKSELEKKWIGSEYSIRQKIRNIFIWNRKHANFWQKIIFRIWSSRGIVVWLSISILRYATGQRWQFLGVLWSAFFKNYLKF